MAGPHLTIGDFFSYVSRNRAMLWEYLFQHIMMVLLGVGLAIIIGVPLGIWCSRSKGAAKIIMAITNVLQVIPSLAMLVLLMMWLGLGMMTVTFGLFLYSLNPVVRNTYVGLTQVNSSYVEAGRGVGMSRMQMLLQVRLPLSLPYILSGIRIAAVIAVGVAAIAPLIGGSGLGREIYAGINNQNPLRIYAGAIPAAVLAIAADIVLGALQRKVNMERRKSRKSDAVPPVPKTQG
ncbi:ABC transporter permease [Paenibacillus protaetiae]|uniref:ABC transporter permease n=1 Tax=Paenibacillus protaetiae TaxID=2509456 RepID=A0A4V0YF89_9BACL|nr:ABC transporter permease [Paenibacillus protaetiae]QAY66871.1 ABC transporter permease [Paenibacillus protaetiae]